MKIKNIDKFKNIKKVIMFILTFICLFNTLNIVKAQNLINYNLTNDYDYMVKDAIHRYPNEARDFNLFLCDYKPFCDYLNYGKNKDILFNFNGLKFDEQGIPKVLYGNSYYYNPVTLAQYGLSLYGGFLEGKVEKDEFIKVVDKLITLQDDRGAFLYNFSWQYYLNKELYKPGWVSGMAQGQALSILSRAYKITGNEKYLKAGEKAFKFLITPISKGGVTTNLGNLDISLKDNIIFEEYISSSATYTLNGFMFTLLGLYDWSNVGGESENKYVAQQYFDKGIDSLSKILHYYDIGGFTAYDLGYITRNGLKPHIGVNYHGVHIYLLKALHSITNNQQLYNYYALWRSYVEADNDDNRIYGDDRYETNVKISEELFKEKVETIVLASGEEYADALSAAPLAFKNNGPILLTPSNFLSSHTKNEIKRLSPKKVIVIGGIGAISKNVCDEIKNINSGITIERLGGKNRYETGVLIAEKLNSNQVFIAYGGDYPDSLSIASIAASKKAPILLTGKEELPSCVEKYINKQGELSKFYIIGQTGVISDKVERKIGNAERIGGNNRYETNVKIFTKFINDMDVKKAYVAIGGPGSKDFADALSCAQLAASNKSPLLLVPCNAGVQRITKDFAYDNFSNSDIIAIGGPNILPNYKISLIKFQKHLNSVSN